MKKNLIMLMATGALLLNVAIAQAESIIKSPVPEMAIYTNSAWTGAAFGPAAETKRGCKMGKSVCKSYMGIVKTGNCGVGESIKNGNISVMKYVDIFNTGWFFNRSTVIKVYGD